jgi:hypothetical protein
MQCLDFFMDATLEVLLSCICLPQVLVVQLMQFLGFRPFSLEVFDLSGQAVDLSLQHQFIGSSLNTNICSQRSNDYATGLYSLHQSTDTQVCLLRALVRPAANRWFSFSIAR